MKHALISSVVLGAVATAGDWIWATFLASHVMAAGLVHGALLCLAMGAMIGRPVGRSGTGAAAGIAVGLAAAGLYYLLAPTLREAAMFVAWFALWMLLAAVYHHLAGAASTGLAIARGAIAGAASGLAFYLVSDMWTGWSPQTINYLDHLLRWTAAFAPGFLVLQGGRRAGSAAAAPTA